MIKLSLSIIFILTLVASCGYSRIGARGTPPKPELTLVKTVHFHTNRDNVVRKELEYLDGNVKWLKNNTNEIIILEGHCDERGSKRSNMDLGDRRANWVKSYLIKRGVNPKKIIVISYGESRPIDPKRNYRAWRKNRRVVFKLGR